MYNIFYIFGWYYRQSEALQQESNKRKHESDEEEKDQVKGKLLI